MPFADDRAAVARPVPLRDLHRALTREHRIAQLRGRRAAAGGQQVVVRVRMFHVVGVVAEKRSRRDIPCHGAKFKVPFDDGKRRRMHVEDRPFLGRHTGVDPR